MCGSVSCAFFQAVSFYWFVLFNFYVLAFVLSYFSILFFFLKKESLFLGTLIAPQAGFLAGLPQVKFS